MKENKPWYIKFADAVQKLIDAAGIPMHASKFSKKTVNLHQHIMIQVYKEKKRSLTYRGLREQLEESKLADYIGLKCAPHFTTPQKFAKRIKAYDLEKIIQSIGKVVKLDDIIAGIDSTGFSMDHASHHYAKRIGRKKPVKGFVKFSGAANLRKGQGYFLGVRIRKRPAHDNKDFIPLANKASRQGKLKRVNADKAHDCGDNHDHVVEKLGAECIIPLRRHTDSRSRIKNKYRKRLFDYFPKRKYNKRNNVEANIGSVKQKTGSVLRARKFRTQKISVLSKIISHNVDVFLKNKRIFNWLGFTKPDASRSKEISILRKIMALMHVCF